MTVKKGTQCVHTRVYRCRNTIDGDVLITNICCYVVGVMARKDNFNINFFFFGGWGNHANICFDFDIPGTFEASFFYLKHIYYLLFIHLVFLHLLYSSNHTPFLAAFTWELGTHLLQGCHKFRKSMCVCGEDEILHFYYSKINLYILILIYISIGEN